MHACTHTHAHTHARTHTHTHEHTNFTKLMQNLEQAAKLRLETDEDSSMELKARQVYSFGEKKCLKVGPKEYSP